MLADTCRQPLIQLRALVSAGMRYAEAIASLEAALALNPSNKELQEGVAFLRAQVGVAVDDDC